MSMLEQIAKGLQHTMSLACCQRPRHGLDNMFTGISGAQHLQCCLVSELAKALYPAFRSTTQLTTAIHAGCSSFAACRSTWLKRTTCCMSIHMKVHMNGELKRSHRELLYEDKMVKHPC